MKDFLVNLKNKIGEILDTKAALLISSCVLLPAAVILFTTQAAGYVRLRNESAAELQPETEISAELPSPAASGAVTLSESDAEPILLKLILDSADRDLDIKITDADGTPVKNEVFTVSVKGSDGRPAYYLSGKDGTCYIEDIEPGEYTVDILKRGSYILSEPVRYLVRGEVRHVKIENIEEIVDIKDVSEISPSEVKTASSSAPAEVTPEVIYSSSLGGADVIYGDTPVLDSNGNPTYTYEFETGPNGYLLYRDTGEESDVIPVDEGYGVYYGLRKVPVETPAPEAPDGSSGTGGNAEGDETAEAAVFSAPQIEYYTVTVDIINPDNTPVDIYSINATPIMQASTAKLGWVTENGQTFYYESDGEKAVGLKNIDGTLYYFNQYGVKAKSVGIDVSFYNPRINWQAVKAQGIDFVIIRIGGRGWSSGDIYDDTCFSRYLSGAKGAGIKVGVYFYSTAISTYEAVEEASVVLDRLSGVSLDYPVFMDVEYSNEYPYGRADNLSAEQRASIVNAFCETIENGGYSAGVYSGQNFFNLGSLYPSSVSRYMIWLASYTKDNKLPNFSSRYDIWQFTDRGIVNGIDGIMDINVIF